MFDSGQSAYKSSLSNCQLYQLQPLVLLNILMQQPMALHRNLSPNAKRAPRKGHSVAGKRQPEGFGPHSKDSHAQRELGHLPPCPGTLRRRRDTAPFAPRLGGAQPQAPGLEDKAGRCRAGAGTGPVPVPRAESRRRAVLPAGLRGAGAGGAAGSGPAPRRSPARRRWPLPLPGRALCRCVPAGVGSAMSSPKNGFYRQEITKTLWEVRDRYRDLQPVGSGAYGAVW